MYSFYVREKSAGIRFLLYYAADNGYRDRYGLPATYFVHPRTNRFNDRLTKRMTIIVLRAWSF